MSVEAIAARDQYEPRPGQAVVPMLCVGDVMCRRDEITPEPPGARSVGLALARLGLVRGSDERPTLVTGLPDVALVHALRALIKERALAFDDARDRYVPTEYGTVLLGPDLRQTGACPAAVRGR